MSELIRINGNLLPKNPSSYNSTTSTMVDEGTSVSGKRLGSIVRSDVAQISLTWNYLTTEEWKAINVLFSGPQYSNKVDFFDQITGTIRTGIEMCVSDRSAGMWRCNVQGDVLGWLGCSLQLTEV